MSRTYKDIKWERRFPEQTWNFNHEKLDGFWNWIEIPGVRTKKRRNQNHEWFWYQATPSSWTRLMMNRPQRRKCRLWERSVLFSDINEADCPFYGKKPHCYYW